MAGSAAGQAQTTDVAGAKFPTTLPLAGTRLQLHGAGIRHTLVFKVDAAAPYLTDKAATPEAALAAAGPKRLQVVVPREIDGNELGKLFTKGMEQNAPREGFSKSIAGILRMSDILSNRKKLQVGESFAIDWVPGAGTVISVNSVREGSPVKEPEFCSALIKIWLGKSPADPLLKEALHGRAPSAVPGTSGYN